MEWTCTSTPPYIFFMALRMDTLPLLRYRAILQGGSNMTGTDLCVNKPHCAAAVRP